MPHALRNCMMFANTNYRAPGSVRYIDERAERDRDQPFPAKSEVVFRWSFACGDVNEREDVIVRVDHAVDQGVPAPDAWLTALRCFDLRRLESIAFATYSQPENLTELRDLRCACLGAAKPVQINNDGQFKPDRKSVV